MQPNKLAATRTGDKLAGSPYSNSLRSLYIDDDDDQLPAVWFARLHPEWPPGGARMRLARSLAHQVARCPDWPAALCRPAGPAGPAGLPGGATLELARELVGCPIGQLLIHFAATSLIVATSSNFAPGQTLKMALDDRKRCRLLLLLLVAAQDFVWLPGCLSARLAGNWLVAKTTTKDRARQRRCNCVSAQHFGKSLALGSIGLGATIRVAGPTSGWPRLEIVLAH